ncbi:MAG: NUDIX domain-containing protein [Phycisphaerales bacterium]|nr:NUDIX domain-containing protein [Phycisphaerales bacterium]
MPVPLIRPTAVAVYVFRCKVRSKYEFLQIRRSSKARSHHHTWQNVSGNIEPREIALQAALRELKEETNLTPIRMFQVECLEIFYCNVSDSLFLMPVFGVEVAPNAKIILNHEHTAHRWIPESQIDSAFMWRTQKEALHLLLDYLRHGSPAAQFLEIPLPL